MKTVEELAREAGIDEWWASGNELRETLQEHLERFAALYREALIAELVAGSGEPELSDNGDVFGHEEVRGYTKEQLAGAVLRERERIAKLVEESHPASNRRMVAAAIRSGA